MGGIASHTSGNPKKYTGEQEGRKMDLPEHRMTPVACDCWFTSTGRQIPRLIKYDDPENGITQIPVSNILRTEEKLWGGTKSRTFHCHSVLGDIEYNYRLIFYLETAKWKIMWD